MYLIFIVKGDRDTNSFVRVDQNIFITEIYAFEDNRSTQLNYLICLAPLSMLTDVIFVWYDHLHACFRYNFVIDTLKYDSEHLLLCADL